MACPAGQVFARVADLAHMTDWSSAKEVRNISQGPLGVGTTFQLVSDLAGGDYVVDYEVTAYKPGHEFAYVSEGAAPTRVTWTFKPAGDRTEVGFHLEVRVSPLLSPLIQGKIKKQTQNDLLRLGEILTRR